MTCIIAVKGENRIYMGADTQVTVGERYEELKESKIFHKGDFLIGCSGSLRCLQLLKHSWVVPENLEALVDSIKDCFFVNNYSKNESNVEEFNDDIIICTKDKIFLMTGDYCLVEVKRDFVCIGSGTDFAYGSMESLWELGLENIVERSLRTVSKYCIYCNNIFNFEEIL